MKFILSRVIIALTSIYLIACSDDPAPQVITNDATAQKPQMSSTELAERAFGTWQINYEDEHLGNVSGTAFIDPVVGTGIVELTHPQTGETHTLQAKRVEVVAGKIVVVLPADSPSANETLVPLGYVAETIKLSTVRLSLGETETQFSIGETPTTSGEVTVRLDLDVKNDVLAGYWRTAIDPSGGELKGRSGFFRYGDADSGGGDMFGRELWQRLKPEIKGSFAVGDQFGATPSGPNWPYPYEVGTETPASGGVAERFLMVVGSNLPRNIREQIEIGSDDPNLHYRVYRTLDSYDSLPPQDAAVRDAGFNYLEQLTREKRAPFERKESDDFLILHVDLKPGVIPGLKTLTINGVETEWVLRFGDHRADVSFVRDITLELRHREDINETDVPMQTMPTEVLYQAEQVYFEVRMKTALPMQDMSFYVAKNGKPILFKGQRSLILKATSVDPLVYRSEAIYLIKPGTRDLYAEDVLVIEVNRMDRIQAQVIDNILLMNPGTVNALVITSPADMREVITQKPASKGLSWSEAVVNSAQCAVEREYSNDTWDAFSNYISLNLVDFVKDSREHLETIGRLERLLRSNSTRALTREESDIFVDWALGNWLSDLRDTGPKVLLETEIKIGEHAAMLIIRQVFIDLMLANLPHYEEQLDDDAILGLRGRLKPFMLYSAKLLKENLGEIGINKVEVPAPDGRMWNLEMSYSSKVLEENYGLSGAAMVDYQIKAMRHARKNFAAAMHNTIKRVQEIDGCDVYELTKLTGVGMEEVVKRAMPILMWKHQGQLGLETWEADWSAQVRIQQVAHIAETLTIQERTSDEHWSDVYLSVSIASLPVGVVSGYLGSTQAFLQATGLILVVDSTHNLYGKLLTQLHEKKELEYALGASAVIGTSRYNAALSNDTHWAEFVWAMIEVGISVRSFRVSWIEAGASRTKASVVRGKEFIDELVEMTATVQKVVIKKFITAMVRAELNPRQQFDLAAAVHDAYGLEKAIGRDAMVPRERQVLEFVDLLVAEQRNKKRPEWALGLSEEAYVRLGALRRRGDIREIVQQHPAEIEQLIFDEIGFRVLHRPQTNLAQLKKTVAILKKRPLNRGQRFVEQTREPDKYQDDMNLAAGGFFIHHEFNQGTSSNKLTLHVYEGRQEERHAVHSLVRDRVSDGVLGTGKDLYRMAGSLRALQVGVADSDKYQTNAANSRNLDLEISLFDDVQGVPVLIVAELRALQLLGFEYRDSALGGIVLPNIRDARLLAELQWMHQIEPDRPINDLYQFTSSFDALEMFAAQAGYRIGRVQIEAAAWESDWPTTAPLQHLTDRQWFVVEDSDHWREEKLEFLETYQQVEEDEPDAKLPYGYDIYVEFVR